MKASLKLTFARSLLVLLAAFHFQGSLARAEPAGKPSSALPGSEFEPVLAEIQAMIKTDEAEVEGFVVREARPERIEKLFRSPHVLQLPMLVRENALIFAGLGSSLLTFDKPSDVIEKVSAWFPAELGEARAAPRTGLGYGGRFRLWGPFENWQTEPMAFMSLWNCVPKSAWLKPDQNPFSRRYEDGFPMQPVAARHGTLAEYDFRYCVYQRSGYLPGWKREDIPRNEARLQKMGERVTPLLRSRFASFLERHACRGSGPDDCVLVMRMWASLLPSDTGLAATMQRLEADVAPDAPLPELHNPNASWSASRPEDGQARFDLALRRAAFLRAKLQSVLNAPQAWPSGTLATTLAQVARVSEVFGVGFVQRWQHYRLNYSNEAVNPWRVFDPVEGMSLETRLAILDQLERLPADKDLDCGTFEQWFRYGGKALRAEYVLRRLRRSDRVEASCVMPDFEWLRQQGDTEFRPVLYGYLALMDHLPQTERNMLARGLTSNRAGCSTEHAPAQPGWLRQLCDKGRYGLVSVRESSR
jgi:hypothetical protein